MRKIIPFVLALCLAGCGGASATTATTTTTTTAPEASATSEGTRQFRVGLEAAYAPNNWQEDTATDTNVAIENVPGAYADGYDISIARSICDQNGWELVVVKMAWDGLIPALNEGQIDAIIAGMADTPERKEAINFSDPYHTTEYGMLVKNDSEYVDATSIQDFSGASILGQKDTLLDSVIDQIEGVNHLTPVSSVPNMIASLNQGACDGIVVNVENAAGYISSNPDCVLVTFEEGEGFELGFAGACVGLRKDDTDTLNAVNEALSNISQETRDEMWNTAVEKQPN